MMQTEGADDLPEVDLDLFQGVHGFSDGDTLFEQEAHVGTTTKDGFVFAGAMKRQECHTTRMTVKKRSSLR